MEKPDTLVKYKIEVVSFGFKKGEQPHANVLMDVRFLKNPYWIPELKPLNGLDRPVRDYVLEQEGAKRFIEKLLALLEDMVPSFFATGKSDTFVIALGCTGGQHRSVAMAEELCRALESKFSSIGIVLTASHREHKTWSSFDQVDIG